MLFVGFTLVACEVEEGKPTPEDEIVEIPDEGDNKEEETPKEDEKPEGKEEEEDDKEEDQESFIELHKTALIKSQGIVTITLDVEKIDELIIFGETSYETSGGYQRSNFYIKGFYIDKIEGEFVSEKFKGDWQDGKTIVDGIFTFTDYQIRLEEKGYGIGVRVSNIHTPEYPVQGKIVVNTKDIKTLTLNILGSSGAAEETIVYFGYNK